MARTASNPHTVRLVKSTKVPAALQANLQCTAALGGTLPNTSAPGSLRLTYSPRFLPSTPVSAGVQWNNYCLDERGGIIGWCDGDHGEPAGAGNSTQRSPFPKANHVRYLNYAGATPFHGVAPGTDGVLHPPRDTYRSSSYSYDSPSSFPGLTTTVQYMSAVGKTNGVIDATPGQLVGYKVRQALAGVMVRIWRGEATNKVELLWEIPDGTPAANLGEGIFVNRPDLSCQSVPYLPEPGAHVCPEGVYIEFIPTVVGQPYTGGISLRRTEARAATTDPRFCLATEYDNYHWCYSRRLKKFFWINRSNGDLTGRDGIYDMVINTWTHGNLGENENMWPTGPWWPDYVSVASISSGFTVDKNCPMGYSEPLDTWVLHNGLRLFLLEPNPNYPVLDATHPMRIRTPLVQSFPYSYNYGGDHNLSHNTGICIGEWFYFIKPMTNAQANARFGAGTSANDIYSPREFWKVRLREPFDQYRELAPFPFWLFTVPWSVNGGAPLLCHDEVSNSILCVGPNLSVYDIDTDTWTDLTPAGYLRCSMMVGGVIKQTRELIMRPGSVEGNFANEDYWYKVLLEDGVKRRMRWVPMVMDRDYRTSPTSGNGTAIDQTPWGGGKHWRFIYTDKYRDWNRNLVREGRVFQIGGDYGNCNPDGNFQVPNYPYTVSYSTAYATGNSGGGLYSGDDTVGPNDILLGYTTITSITQDIVIRDAATRTGTAAVLYTIPSGTPHSTVVNLDLATAPRATAGMFPEFTAQQKVDIRWGKRKSPDSPLSASAKYGNAGDYYDSFNVTTTLTADIEVRDSTSAGTGSLIHTIPAGTVAGTPVSLPAPVLLVNGAYFNFLGTGAGRPRRFVPYTMRLPNSRRIATSTEGVMGVRVTQVPTHDINFYNAGIGGPAVGATPVFTIAAGSPVGTTTINETNPTRTVYTQGLYAEFLGGDGAVTFARDGTWAMDSGRQDQYSAPVAEVNGKVQVELFMNHTAFYPWPGGPDPVTTQQGPKHPDGVGLVFDRDGYGWVTPYYRFDIPTLPDSSLESGDYVYRFRVPQKYTAAVRTARGYTAAATDIAMGDGYDRPQQVPITSMWQYFGGSSCWITYDPAQHCLMAVSSRNLSNYRMMKFPCTPDPVDGIHRWSVVTKTRSQSALMTEAALHTRRLEAEYTYGSALKSSWQPDPTPGTYFTGPQAVIGDYIYSMQLWGNAGAEYRDNQLSYLIKVNLRNEDDFEYIWLPHDINPLTGDPYIFWHRDWDAMGIVGGIRGIDSINEGRSVQALGHLLVFSPPAHSCKLDDPFIFWYDTNAGTWHNGPTYRELMNNDPAAPRWTYDSDHSVWSEGPRMTRGNFVCVPETGEVWVPTGGYLQQHPLDGNKNPIGTYYRGTIKIRIW